MAAMTDRAERDRLYRESHREERRAYDRAYRNRRRYQARARQPEFAVKFISIGRLFIGWRQG